MTAATRGVDGHGPAGVRGAVLLATCLCAPAALAQGWHLTPHVGANLVYSDNVDLAPSGSESDDFITTVNTGASLRRRGGRMEVNFDYNLQASRYANSSGGDGLSHQLQTDADIELVEQMLFLELGGTVSQENTSSTGRSDTSNLAVTGNTSDVVTYRITPVVRHHFGDYADGEVRYGFDTVDTGGAGTGRTRRITANLQSGDRFVQVPWTLATTRTRIKNDSGTETRFSRFEGTARYKFTRQYGVVVSGGYERNKFATTAGDDSGPIWSVGGTWTPTPRTSVEAGYRSRFFDPGYFLSASHQMRRTVFEISYDEELTTTSEQLLDRQLIPLEDAFGEPVTDPLTGDQVELPVNRATFTEEVQVSRSLQASATWRGRRSGASLRLFSDIRDFQLSGDEERVYGFSVNADRQLSHRMSVEVMASWQRTSPGTGGLSFEQWQVGAGLNYTVSPDITTSLDIRRLSRDSADTTSAYDEHRATLRVDVTF